MSFNANKIITTGSGGMILTNNSKLAQKAKYLSTQAKDDSIFFAHNEIGYNYRMNNVSAALGISQIKQLKYFIRQKRIIRNFYIAKIEKIKNLEITKNPDYSLNNNWLNILKINKKYKRSRNQLINHMIKNKISVRPVWKLNHLQKPFKHSQSYEIKNASNLVKYSLCLPSAPNLNIKDLKKILFQLNA